jgi:hypothetical protein
MRHGYVTMRNIAAILAERLQGENERYREPGDPTGRGGTRESGQ